jgi:hypothetical protein
LNNANWTLDDPWLRFLWDLRGTYNGTLIDFEARREELEEMFREQPRSTTLGTGGGLEHGSNQLRPDKDPQP